MAKTIHNKKTANGSSSLSEVNTGFHDVDPMGVLRQAHRCGVKIMLLEAEAAGLTLEFVERPHPRRNMQGIPSWESLLTASSRWRD